MVYAAVISLGKTVLSSPFFHLDRPRLHRTLGLNGYLRLPPGPPMVLPGVSRVLHLVLVPVPNHINVRTTVRGV